MKKNVFDRISDSYDNFHLKGSEINVGKGTLVVSPKLKLILGWSLFVLCCVIGGIIIGSPFSKGKELTQEDKEAVLKEDIALDEEHDTIVPYEKDADEELNAFIESYFKAITECDAVALQEMVTDPSEYRSDAMLKQKAEFITAYDNITVYTKVGLDEGSYIAFVVTNISIAGVNSSPYDITTLYIINGARGYLVNNGTLSLDTQEYIEKVKGDKDIQKIYRAVEKENNELKEKDSSLQEFFEIISRRDVEVDAAADYLNSEENSEEAASSEASTDATTEATTEQVEAVDGNEDGAEQ